MHSYSPAAEAAFRDWLRRRYRAVEALNAAWGTSFWSMRHSDLGQMELPNQVVEEPSPTHLTDFLRISSGQLIAFNRMHVNILRAHAPGRPITHDFMNQNTDFDHHEIGRDIDLASWDAYPLGNLIHGRLPEVDKARYPRTGDPDQPGFSHDLHRGVGHGRVWVMEQQPGPVNWADRNPAPADGTALPAARFHLGAREIPRPALPPGPKRETAPPRKPERVKKTEERDHGRLGGSQERDR